jgi:hypothetical protein
VNQEGWKTVEEFGIGEKGEKAESDHLEIALKKRRSGKEVLLCLRKV